MDDVMNPAIALIPLFHSFHAQTCTLCGMDVDISDPAILLFRLH